MGDNWEGRRSAEKNLELVAMNQLIMHSGHESTDVAKTANFLLGVLTTMPCKIHEVSLLISQHANKLKCST